LHGRLGTVLVACELHVNIDPSMRHDASSCPLLLLPAARSGWGLAADDGHDLAAAVRKALEKATGSPVTVASLPPALFLQVLDSGRDVVAWAPPMVARDLIRDGAAAPMAIAVPPAPLSAVLVGRPAIESLADIAGAHVGWVSRVSGTGYRIPRLYLESFGLRLHRVFASERTYGSHAAVAEALLDGEIDVAATHTESAARHLREPLESGRVRVLTSIGPVPADMILASAGIPESTRAAVARALLGVSAGPHRFAPPRAGHLDLIDQLTPPPLGRPASPRESGIMALA
jgi:ABC-type phosphate/phosphonate transport system substrate-binding protein